MAQWLDRVKFGNGKDGLPPSTLENNNGQGWGTFTGTAGQTSGTYTDVYAGWRVNADDIVLIHQSQGTGAGQWELNVAVAGFSSLPAHTVYFKYPLAYTYGAGCQIVRVPQYLGGTLSATLAGITSWNGTYGGIVALMCNGDLTISGSINVSGAGFRGAQQQATNDQDGYQGEGTAGAGNTQSISVNGNGAGGGDGGRSLDFSSGGGGGGNGAAGAQGAQGQQYAGGLGGNAVGNAGLTNMCFGGGGSSGGMGRGGFVALSGGAGGGCIFIFCKTITSSSGTLSANGVAGGSGGGSTSGGGGGAGGSILIKCQSGVLGTTRITANAGSAGTGTINGGAGGVGRIHIDYADSYSGSTTPTLDAAQVTSLKSQIYGGMI